MTVSIPYLVYLTIIAIGILAGIVMIDHYQMQSKIDEQKNQMQQMNLTMNNIANFIINQQIPFDQQVLNYTHSHK